MATSFVTLPTQRNRLLSLRHPSLITFSSMEISTQQPREDLQTSLTVIQTIACWALAAPVQTKPSPTLCLPLGAFSFGGTQFELSFFFPSSFSSSSFKLSGMSGLLMLSPVFQAKHNNLAARPQKQPKVQGLMIKQLFLIRFLAWFCQLKRLI